ncbi:MAG: CPBP family intramembrane metalloprotease, partial [Clostridiales bacterium]|nr:CPBP family intramembrane metalloprotease [Candidatus Crickella merdequi]
IVTSITFGIGHIVNLVNGNSADYVGTICQIFYAVAIGFLLAAVLYVGKSLIPCIITHSMLNALSSFSNETVISNIQIPVSIVLCVVSAVSAIVIFKNTKEDRIKEKE